MFSVQTPPGSLKKWDYFTVSSFHFNSHNSYNLNTVFCFFFFSCRFFRRWMAPEVIRHEPYGEAADVYSYGEMCCCCYRDFVLQSLYSPTHGTRFSLFLSFIVFLLVCLPPLTTSNMVDFIFSFWKCRRSWRSDRLTLDVYLFFSKTCAQCEVNISSLSNPKPKPGTSTRCAHPSTALELYDVTHTYNR